MSLGIDSKLHGSCNTTTQRGGCEVSSGAEHHGSGS
jgi:hypothetical protein